MSRKPEPTAPAPSADEIVSRVRERYGRIAEGAISGCCSGATCAPGAAETETAHAIGYDAASLTGIPTDANLGLGCGAPIPHLELRPGETVLDLGSGGGLDAFLAARSVGPTGRVLGVDMTPEMIGRARAAARSGGYDNVEFRLGRLEALPVAEASVDAVTSNCVINLVPDKEAVFREIARVLRPGGRLVVSDIVLDGTLPQAIATNMLAWAGCIAGALPRAEYFGLVERAGLGAPEILRDVDYLATIGDLLPEEIVEAARGAGIEPADLAGRVRSITFRAWRR